MKKIIIFLFISAPILFAQTEMDIALTLSNNKFDDSFIFPPSKVFTGVRVGVYQDKTYGMQLGYEYKNNINCSGINLKRVYANALAQMNLSKESNLYAIGTLGYETSSIKRQKPNQTVYGAGVGAKYHFTPNINGFVEARFLNKKETKDRDSITTLGVGYTFDGLRY